MQKKKFNYKAPSIIALTLAGTALTTHHAQASEKTQDQTTNKNILDDNSTVKQAEQTKSEVSNPTTNVSGTQAYKDPSVVEETQNEATSTYDAKLDELTNEDSAQNNEATTEQQVDNTDTANTDNDVSSANSAQSTDTQNDDQASAQDQNSSAEVRQQDDAASNTDSDAKYDVNAQADDQAKDNMTEKAQQDTATSEDSDAQVSAQDQDSSAEASQQDAATSNTDSDADAKYDVNAQADDQAKDNMTEKAQQDTATSEDSDAQVSAQDQNSSAEASQQDAAASDDSDAQTSAQDQNSSAEASQQDDITSTTGSDVKYDVNTQADEQAKDNTTDKAQQDKADNDATAQNETTNVSDVQAQNSDETSVTDGQSSEDLPQDDQTPVVTATQNRSVQDDTDKTTATNESVNNDVESNTLTTETANDDVENNTLTTEATNEQQVEPRTMRLESAPKMRSFAATSTSDDNNTTVKREAGDLPKYQPTVDSSVNDYIREQNFTAPNYESDIADYLPQYDYRNGAPEGIVLHDTANDNSTIEGEINYMKNNYNNAFVHAYVDGDRIIETANTDYLSWGGGPVANERYIQVELVHTHTPEDFARSMNNYADYAATNLRYYGLSPDSAEYDGQGTVWTHKAVSNYLGGTDHTDPHDYLARNNYSYDELYDLINEKYLIQTGQVADWGESGSSDSGDTSENDDNTNDTETPSTNDELTVNELTDKQGTVKENNNGVYTSVYDEKGVQKSYVNGTTYDLTKEAKLGDKSFYLIADQKSKDSIGWMQTGDITVKQDENTTTDKLTVSELENTRGTVKENNNGVYTSVYDKQGVQKSYVNGTTYDLTKKADYGDKSFYLITDQKSKDNLGWMQTGDIVIQQSATKEATTEATKETTPRTANTNTQNTATQTATKNVKQLGQFTTEKPEIKTSVNGNTALNSTKYANKTFTVGKQRTQGDNTYVLIQNNKDNTPIGWVNSKDINTRNLSQSAAKSGNYTVKPTNNGLYAVPWGSKAQKLDDLNNLQQNDFKASKSLHVDKDEYVYGIVNNKTGWIAANDLNAKHHPTATNEASNKDDNTNASDDAVESRYDYVIYNKDGYYYNDPYGKASGSLSDYNEGIFTSYKKLVIDGVTWYYGKLANGEMVWIKETDLRKELIKYYSTGQTLDEAALAQYNLKFKPQVQHTPGEWEDANLGEIKYAMDSSRIANDETQKYQFLRLDKSQNIDANRINELLDGKGILEGQGEAFSEAAKTYNINEVYLVSHALLETGNGTSELANGGDVVDDEVTTDGPNKYYNMFGIGAVDHDAVKQGFTRAKEEGWDTVKKAIVGGAKFIANSYINQGQNTLYKMRWNPENPGDHQYATDISWAEKNATRIKNFYDTMGEVGKYFDVNTYTK